MILLNNMFLALILTSFSSLLFLILFIFSRIREKKLLKQSGEILVSYQTYLNKISDIISLSNRKLLIIDEKGSFKSDDEVGFFFDTLLEIQNTLNNFIIVEENDTNTEEKK